MCFNRGICLCIKLFPSLELLISNCSSLLPFIHKAWVIILGSAKNVLQTITHCVIFFILVFIETDVVFEIKILAHVEISWFYVSSLLEIIYVRILVYLKVVNRGTITPQIVQRVTELEHARRLLRVHVQDLVFYTQRHWFNCKLLIWLIL